jgi:hypothetical protein
VSSFIGRAYENVKKVCKIVNKDRRKLRFGEQWRIMTCQRIERENRNLAGRSSRCRLLTGQDSSHSVRTHWHLPDLAHGEVFLVFENEIVSTRESLQVIPVQSPTLLQVISKKVGSIGAYSSSRNIGSFACRGMDLISMKGPPSIRNVRMTKKVSGRMAF